MADIYQQLWDADQQHAGLRAVRPGGPTPAAHGYVVVDEDAGAGPDHRLVVDAVIPDGKARTDRPSAP